MAEFDLIVIGGGPGGYVCAIRAAQLGLKTACVEGRETLGGTCLNVGCIPSKALLNATHLLHETHENFEKMGLMGAKPTVDWERMLRYKDDVIAGNTKGIEFLFKKNKVTWLKGWGSIPEPGKVKVGDEVHSAKNTVIATGSEASVLSGITVDEEAIVTSTGALALREIPKSMVVIGAGVIGLEMGSVYARLGAEVTVVEYLDAITPGMDAEVAKAFQKILVKQGLKFVLGAAVQGTERTATGAKVAYKLRKDDSAHEIEAEAVLLATGRRPYTTGLGLTEAGVEMEPRGQVKIDGHFQTTVKGIYAIGDAVLPQAQLRLDHFLRDHYTGEVGTIDPQLFDLLYRLRMTLGTRLSFQVISGYRSPFTNNRLRTTRSGGVAKRSLHMDGKAIDIRLPGVALSDLRDAALSLKAGGVGFYANEDFVHIDTGKIRSW